MSPRRIISALAAVSLAVLAGACGDGDGTARTMTVVGTEMAFGAPARVPAGDYAVTFRNGGAAHHELAFRDPAGEFVVRRSVAPGDSVTMEIALDEGTWELGCFELGHYEAGMHRQLVVEPAGSD